MLKLNNKFFIGNKKLILFSSGAAIFLSISSSFILLPLVIILTASLIFIYGGKALLGIIIIGYLTTPTEYFGESRVYINLVISALLFFLFIKKFGIQTKKFLRVPKEIFLFLTVLFITFFLSTIFSSYPLTGFLAIIRTCIFFVICYLFYALLKDEQNIFIYIYSVCSVVVILGIRMLIDFYNLGLQNYFIRVSLNENSDLYGSLSYTGVIIFFISISLITAMFFMNKFNKIGKRFLLLIFLIFNIIILILANSRGSIMAALISIFFILVILKKSLFIKILLTVSIIITLLLFTIPDLQETLNIYLRFDRAGTRVIFWEVGIDIIKDHPVFGVGADLFDKYFYNYAPSFVYDYFKSGVAIFGRPHPHNFFLYFTAENGILGLITSIVFFILFFYFAIKTLQITKNINRDYFILSTAITGIGIGIFFRSFIEVTGYLTYGYITRDLPFWLMFGILISIYQKFKDHLSYSKGKVQYLLKNS